MNIALAIKISDTPHYENVPFEVPAGWEWTEVASFTYDLLYGTSEKSSNDGSVPVLRMGNITRYGTIDYTDLVYSSNDDDIIKYQLQKNDLLFNRTNSSEWVGKTAIFKADTPTIYAGYLIRVRCILLCPDYINLVMNSSYHRNWCNQVKTDAVNQSNINAQKLSKLLIPIPPYQEQLRIVKEVQRWTDVIDDLEKNKQDLQDVIKQTKGKVLDLAIHGKLVPQDPMDEPASELLKRINPDAKPCDTSHYENLPNGWAITSMQNVCQLADGEKQEGIERINLDVKYLRGKGEGELTAKGKYVPADSTMILVDGENSGEIFDTPIEGYQGSTFKLLNINSQMFKPFVLYVIKSHQRNLRENKVGSAIPHLNKKLFREIVIWVPPLREQQQIVVKIQEIFASLDSILVEL